MKNLFLFFYKDKNVVLILIYNYIVESKIEIFNQIHKFKFEVKLLGSILKKGAISVIHIHQIKTFKG
jgi:hypothetical protein